MDLRLVVTTIVASCVGAIVGTLAVAYVSGTTIERQADAKLLEMSVGILRENARMDDDPMRAWAIKVVERKSGVAFTDAP